MDDSWLIKGLVITTQLLILGYMLLGWCVWMGWLRIENEGRFGRLATHAGKHFGIYWENARWFLLAGVIIVSCALVASVAFAVAMMLRPLAQ